MVFENQRKSIVPVQHFRGNQLTVRKSSESVLVQLEDDEHKEGPFGSESISLYPVREIKVKPDWMRTSDDLPDFNIWIYNSRSLLRLGEKKFDQVIKERLPFSFVWLLGEMSSMIHQPKRSIYQQLVTIELAYSKRAQKKRRK